MSYSKPLNLTNNITSTSATTSTDDYSLVSVQFGYTDITPAADSFVDGDVNITTDEITMTSHGFITGLVGQLTTTGALPTGLSAATNYYVIKVSDNIVKLASSYNNAIAGTAVDITAAAGTGTHTFTPTALSATVKLQSTVNGDDWIDISGKSTAVSATGSAIHTLSDFAEPMIRTVVTQTSGVMNLEVVVFGKK